MRKIFVSLVLVVTTLMVGCQEGGNENTNVKTSSGTSAGGSPSATTPSTSKVDIQTIPSVGKSKAGGIDSINGRGSADSSFGKIDSKQATNITVSGWFIDEQAQRAAEGVFVNVDGKLDVPASYGIDRKDVADLFKNDAIRFSGFEASIPVGNLENGRHTLSLKIVKGDKSGYYESDRKVNIDIQ